MGAACPLPPSILLLSIPWGASTWNGEDPHHSRSLSVRVVFPANLSRRAPDRIGGSDPRRSWDLRPGQHEIRGTHIGTTKEDDARRTVQ
jgi:hypothetical protein